jgi:hypothetical protein
MSVTAGEKRIALISEAADLILKGGGMAALAAVPATICFKTSLLIMIVPLAAAALTLWFFAGFLFLVAAVRLEAVFLGGERISRMVINFLSYALACVIVFSLMSLMFYFGSTVPRQIL